MKTLRNKDQHENFQIYSITSLVTTSESTVIEDRFSHGEVCIHKQQRHRSVCVTPLSVQQNAGLFRENKRETIQTPSV